jgi:hypothetical protein
MGKSEDVKKTHSSIERRGACGGEEGAQHEQQG